MIRVSILIIHFELWSFKSSNQNGHFYHRPGTRCYDLLQVTNALYLWLTQQLFFNIYIYMRRYVSMRKRGSWNGRGHESSFDRDTLSTSTPTSDLLHLQLHPGELPSQSLSPCGTTCVLLFLSQTNNIFISKFYFLLVNIVFFWQ